jgi:hypothetical protein
LCLYVYVYIHTMYTYDMALASITGDDIFNFGNYVYIFNLVVICICLTLCLYVYVYIHTMYTYDMALASITGDDIFNFGNYVFICISIYSYNVCMFM